ncbi:MAG: altronate dehydratase [Planctomycetota bacterium]|nr:MAG: altronate dehydratase [Planctomycetota bacterium]
MVSSPNSPRTFIRLSPRDNVIVALQNLSAGQRITVDGQTVEVAEAVPPGHKVAICRVEEGQPILKFGWPIGVASRRISVGQHVHTHNVRCDHRVDPENIATEIPAPPPPVPGATFRGYVRPGGRVGTRNYLAIISNVNCSASVARMIANRFDAQALSPYPNIDGVISFRHEGGCAMKWRGSRHEMLTRVLGGLARHPNIGGYLLVGLGCEQGTLDHLIENQRLYAIGETEAGQAPAAGQPSRVPALTIQGSGGTMATVERGVEIVARMLPQVNAVERTEVPASHLILGTECGGSDGYSGITANPALGVAADLLVACGGTVILSETSEIYGAEHLLTRRARNRQVGEKLLERIAWWQQYCANYGEEFDNNPSVGNKAGGLTTITEKSLGAVYKGGTTTLEAVYEYAEPIDARGFVVMDTPGFDPASVTGMVAGGANLIAFTTGRGSCFGYKPVPSFKIASNTALYQRLPDDMDFNAGVVVEGRSIQDVGRDIFNALLEVASGRQTCSERLGIGDEEFVPWLVGPVL